MIEKALRPGGALFALTSRRQFLCYSLTPSQRKLGKMEKLPVDPATGRTVNAQDPAHWVDAETAIAAAMRLGPNHGVAFVFTGDDNFWFLDIDGAYVNGAWSQIAQALCAAFPGAAVEVSQSGTGLHIFGSGKAPAHGCKNLAYGLEFYTEARFVALTGTNAVGDAAIDFAHLLPALVAQFFQPVQGVDINPVAWTNKPRDDWRGPDDDTQLVTRALRSQSANAVFGNKASFADLWTGNVEALARAYPDTNGGAPYDASSADSALAQHLAFWVGCDCERILRLMRQSALVREKWEREDYLPRTILAVCARQSDVLQDKPPEPVRLTHTPPATGERRTSPRPEPVTGSTFLTIEQQLDLFAGCVYVIDQHAALTPGGVLLDSQRFRAVFGGYSFPMDTANERTSRDAWEAFTQSQAFRVPRADGTCFKPNLEPGEIVNDGGRTLVNTWWPVDVPRQPGDATPFLTHLRKLLPNERDQQILLSYMAACVQHVGVKFQWAPLLQGVEGNGKTLLTRCVAHAVGRRYVHWPKASKLSNQFNGWMLGKVFYAVEDIYTGGSGPNKRDVIEELKPMITGGDGLEIEGKGRDQFSADVCGNFMFNTNFKDALPKTRNDRRYAIFYTAQQEAADLKRDGMDGVYMSTLYDWLKNGGYAIVADLLATWPIPEEFNPAGAICQRAPETSSTEEAVQASLGAIEQEIMEAVQQGEQGFRGDWISSVWLSKLLEEKRKHLSITRYKEVLARVGYVPHPGLGDGRVNNVVLPDGKKPRLYVKTGSQPFYLQGPTVIANAYSAAQGMMMPAPMSA